MKASRAALAALDQLKAFTEDDWTYFLGALEFILEERGQTAPLELVERDPVELVEDRADLESAMEGDVQPEEADLVIPDEDEEQQPAAQ